MRLTTKIAIDRWLGNALLRAVIALAALRTRIPRTPQPRTIAVIKLLGLGSIIQATPLIRALAERYPAARIMFVTKRGNDQLTSRIPDIHETMCIDDTSPSRLFRSLFSTLRDLRRREALCVVNLEAYSNLGALMAIASGAQWRAGFFRNPSDLRLTARFDRLVYFNPAAPVSEVYLQLGRALGATSATPTLTRIVTQASDRDEVAQALNTFGIDFDTASLLVVNPNASELRLERRWPAERFAQLIDQLTPEYPQSRVVLVGAPDEHEYVESIVRFLPDEIRARVVNLAGRIRFGGLVALLERARLLVTNDSGPMHVAYSVGTPVVALFGPVAPGHYALQNVSGKHIALYHRTYCSPCVHHFDEAPCRGDNVCLKSIPAELAMTAARSLLEGSPAPALKTDIVYVDHGRPIGVAGAPCREMPCRNLLAQTLVSRKDLTVKYCPNCGLAHADPFPSDAALAAIYGAHYYQSWDLRDGGKATAEMKRATFRRRIERGQAWLKPGARVLDLGCATGYFLEEARAAGLEPFGVDIAADAIAQCEAKIGAGRCYAGEFADAHFAANADGLFEAIFMSDYLEHVRDPKAVLALAARHLVASGVVVITTPDVESWTRHLMRERWPHFKVEHLWYFSRRALERVLAEAGLSLVSSRATTKTLTLSYIAAQFRQYPHPWLTPLCEALMRIMPARIANAHLRVPTGEMTVIAVKNAAI